MGLQKVGPKSRRRNSGGQRVCSTHMHRQHFTHTHVEAHARPTHSLGSGLNRVWACAWDLGLGPGVLGLGLGSLGRRPKLA